jgi:hypothetical protein
MEIEGKRKRDETNMLATPSSALAGSSSDGNSAVVWRNSPNENDFDVMNNPQSLEQMWNLISSALRSRLNRSNLQLVATLSRAGDAQPNSILRAFQEWVMHQITGGSPGIDQLLVLVKFNVIRALLNNGRDLGYSADGEYVEDEDALSPFFKSKQPLPPFPPALCPTETQSQFPHHPWLDLIPVPQMRDNLLRAGDSFDEMKLCADLTGLFHEECTENGMIIWGEPWDQRGWEVSESFLNDWGWALQGCDELIQSTNHWRRKRDETPLSLSPMFDAS